jgi:Protein of unknown function (DUF3551)
MTYRRLRIFEAFIQTSIARTQFWSPQSGRRIDWRHIGTDLAEFDGKGVMCKSLFGVTVAAGLVTALSFIAGTAAAEPYKWCAEYSGGMGSANCGFVTLEQCQATISGTGGFCRPNGFYTGPAEKPAKREGK